MPSEENHLRRMLAGLRRSQTRTFLALKIAGSGIGAKLGRVKLEAVNRAIKDVMHRLRTLGQKRP